jgi:hypothetical protein
MTILLYKKIQTMKNLKLLFLTLFSVISLSVFAQDTLTINGNNCQFIEGTSVTQIQNCNYDFDAIDTAFLSYVVLPNNPMGNMAMHWEFLDTTGAPTEFVTYDYPFITDGCYQFTLTVFCPQDTIGINTVVVHDAHAVWVSWGLDEITQTEKTLVKVIDIMGRETIPTTNKPLIYVYSNGTKEIRYISE